MSYDGACFVKGMGTVLESENMNCFSHYADSTAVPQALTMALGLWLLVKCSPNRHKDLSLDPQNLSEKLLWLFTFVCGPKIEKVEAERSLRFTVQPPWLTQRALESVRDCLKK